MNVVVAERGWLDTPQLKTWVYSGCGSVIGAYYCASCAESFPTRAHFIWHCRDKPDVQHHVVFNCQRHGFEVPPPPPSKESETA